MLADRPHSHFMITSQHQTKGKGKNMADTKPTSTPTPADDDTAAGAGATETATTMVTVTEAPSPSTPRRSRRGSAVPAMSAALGRRSAARRSLTGTANVRKLYVFR